MRIQDIKDKKNQEGVALVVSLIFLVILTVLGVFSIQNNTLQERMSGNYRDHHIAFEAAELALRIAEEATVQGQHSGSPLNLITISSSQDPWDPEIWKSNITSQPDKIHTLPAGMAPNSNQQPIFFIEEMELPFIADSEEADPVTDAALDGSLEPERARNLFRLTAIGFGGTDDTVVILQSTYYR